MMQEPDDDTEFQNLWWAMEQGFPDARERLADFQRQRHDEWAPIRDALPKSGTVLATASRTLCPSAWRPLRCGASMRRLARSGASKPRGESPDIGTPRGTSGEG